ncbi:XLF-domain-containing protein [Hypoxylon sp. FL0543]|nr:XLF-domain-containing protein [Hypoxylon sp. FL0543]
MTSGPKWHPLPAFPDLPALMISPRFASSSYVIHVTDLANVWVERLDRRGILLRSLQEDTSIDLSDGDLSQWGVFLSKLNAAFDPTLPDNHSTSLSISASASSPDGSSDGGLVLHVTCVLPKPLRPLKWPVYLTKCPPVGVASELVLPLIQSHHARTVEIEDLIARLKEKDAVITKLVDKLEANQTGLEHVFNSLSGKRKPSRALAEEKVKGLAAFNENDWKSTVAANQQPPKDVSSLIREVFAETGLHCNVDAEITPSSQLNDWWTKLVSRPSVAIRPQKETPKKAQNTPSPRAKAIEERDDDDFQVQATPPHLQSRRRKEPYSKAADDSTEDDDGPAEIPDSHPLPSQEKHRSQTGAVGGRKEAAHDTSASQSSRTIPADDDETPSESDTESVQPQHRVRPNARLGTIGRSKESSPPPAVSPSPVPPASNGDDETALGSESETNEPRPSKAQSSSPPNTPVQRRKAGLGRIGGKPKSRVTPEPSQEPNMATPEAASPDASVSPAKAAGRKLGIIGKKPDMDGKRQRSDSPAITDEPETEEQRTERRRAELAKELERKAAAPTKKKRKF